ncbi:MAG: hypothetical protein N838_32510, partial [Thiohalocapsa sp. PB-PSB1]
LFESKSMCLSSKSGELFDLHANEYTVRRQNTTMNIAVLLGAGSSVPAGYPSTQDLTDHVLSGQGVSRHSDASYYLRGDESPKGTTRLVNSVVRRLYAESEHYFFEHAARRSNYEDLFYLATQATDDLLGEMENPAIRSFLNNLASDLSPLISAVEDADCSTLQDLFVETRNYIADVVWRSLSGKPSSVEQLTVLTDLCRSYNVVSISTLSHDTHLENHLSGESIMFSDGFSKPRGGVRYWNADFSETIPFLKLHGSVNWFRLRPDSGDWRDEKIGIPISSDFHHTRTESGELQTAIDGRPLLLIGTFNKISEYSSGMFRELHHHFRSTINNAERIVVCGYGFGDKGINAEIIDWFYSTRGRRIIVVHPDPGSLRKHARGAIRNKWAAWEKANSLLILAKRLEQVEAVQLAELIAL